MIQVRGVGQRAGGGRRTLRDVSLAIGAGELVAIIGGSGAGKTTLLDAIAGVRPPAEGEVRFDGDAGSLGYVPQDDIVHMELPLRRTLRYAAGLRLPAGTSPERAEHAVDAALDALALTGRAAQRVGSLSGGERKRASIAVELLTRPRVFFLDEPTSGLDPATAADLMRILRGLADSGTTVVLTTHHPPDVAVCDQVAVLALDGTLAFCGAPRQALDHFQAAAFEDVYLRLASSRHTGPDAPPEDGASTTGTDTTRAGATRASTDGTDDVGMDDVGTDSASTDSASTDAASTGGAGADDVGTDEVGTDSASTDTGTDGVSADGASAGSTGTDSVGTGGASTGGMGTGGIGTDGVGADGVGAGGAGVGLGVEGGSRVRGGRVGGWRQWGLLARRSADLLTRNRLTLAVLAGSPVMVLVMFAVLFRPGAFSPESPSPSATVMILFWIAFGGFFFGLTYGLLQICTELPVLRRERLTGVRVGAYVLAKVAVLLPLLAVVDALMLGVLRALDRLPAVGWGTYGELFVTLLLCSLAALALGLLVSAAVTDPAQATMALPMLCFPQVLFVGAILPVPVMAAPGRWLSYAMSNRWAFEGLGHSLGVERLWATGRSPLGPPLLASYGDTFSRAVAVDWALLGGFTALFLMGTWVVLLKRT